MRKEIRLFYVFISIALVGGLFLLPLPYSIEAREKRERLEDYSRYGDTLRYKDRDVYTIDPSDTRSPYHWGGQKLPPALRAHEQETPKREKWSRPEELQRLGPEELYMRPLPQDLPHFTFREKGEKIETREGEGEGEVQVQVGSLENKVALAIESITGKPPTLNLIDDQEAELVKPVAPVEEEEEEEKSKQEPLQGEGADEWKLLIIKEGTITLKPPSGTSKNDLQAITAHLAHILGRGGEITTVPEGIQINLK